MEHPLARLAVVYPHPEAEAVEVHRDVELAGMRADLYRPRGAAGSLPAVVFVSGYPDSGFQRAMGRSFNEMGGVESWARLIAADCGFAAIPFANRGFPGADAQRFMQALADDGVAGVDSTRLAVWASSGNAPAALSVVAKLPQTVRCGVFLYPFLLGATASEASAQYKFDYSCCEVLSVGSLPGNTPLLLMRAGQDEFPGLNESIEAFAAEAKSRKIPVTLCDAPEARHAFDLMQDTADSRRTIRQVLDFLKTRL